MNELGVESGAGKIIEVWNKIDKLKGAPDPSGASDGVKILVSAVTGQGLDTLVAAIEERLARGRTTLSLKLDPADGAGLHWLYENAEVLSRKDEKSGRIALKLRVAPEVVDRVKRRFAV